MHHSKLLESEIPAVEGGYSRSVTWKGLPEEVAFRLTLRVRRNLETIKGTEGRYSWQRKPV